MNAKQLAQWILSLPEDIQSGSVTSIVHGMTFTAKRVVAYRSKDGSDAGIYTESMGTHLKDGTPFDFISTLSH